MIKEYCEINDKLFKFQKENSGVKLTNDSHGRKINKTQTLKTYRSNVLLVTFVAMGTKIKIQRENMLSECCNLLRRAYFFVSSKLAT